MTASASEPSAARGERSASGKDEGAARSRTVWWTAGAVGAVMLALVAWQALIPRPFLTGSDSVGFRSVVAELQPGQRLCVGDLDLPAGTGGVRFVATASQAEATAALRVTAGDRSYAARASGRAGPDGRIALEGYFPSGATAADAASATACLTARDGVLGVGGMGGSQGDQRPARLDGAPLPSRVAVSFLPPEGERRSLLADAGDVLARAAVFRPAGVGPWTYALLLLVVLPGISVGAVALLARTAAGRRTPVPAAGAVAAIAFANAGAWALVTPPFEGPDEGDHVAYAQHLAETGDGLEAGAPAYSADLVVALDGVRAYSHVGLADARPPWRAEDELRWQRYRAAAPRSRDDGGGPTIATAPNTPLYYALLAPAYRAASGGSAFAQLTAMRLATALLGAVVAVCAFGIVRELLPRQQLAAVGAGLLVAFQPMLAFMAGVVNNDTGVNALAALALYLTIRVLRRGPTWRSMLALGATLAALPLMKSTGYALYVPIALGLAASAWRHRRRLDLPAWGALAGALLVVRGGWELLVPAGGISGGAAGTGASLANVHLALEQPKQYLLYLWQTFLPPLPFMHDLFPQGWPAFGIYVEESWAAFGWLTIRFPRWVYVTIVVTMLLVAVLAVAAVLRERAAARRRRAELLVLALVPPCVVAAVAAALFAPQGRPVPAEQGRYAFTAIAALAAITIGGTFALGCRRHVALLTALVVATIGFSYAARLLALERFFT